MAAARDPEVLPVRFSELDEGDDFAARPDAPTAAVPYFLRSPL